MPKFKCPSCGGEFDSWDGGQFGPKKCPFCEKKKGSYGGGMWAS